MFKYRESKDHFPIYSWIPEDEYKEDNNLVNQVENLASLDFLYHHVALMADGHLGLGMPIGGVIATLNEVIPSAVGNDIACGVSLIKTDINVDNLDGEISHLSGQIMRSVPLGFNRRNKLYENSTGKKFIADRDEFMQKFKSKYEGMDPEIEEELIEVAPVQLGTLGGGNHFIEIIEFEDNKVGFMCHSGSRHLGAVIAKKFIDIAERLNNEFNLENGKLSYLPINSEFFDFGQKYIDYMNFCKKFARMNRGLILEICFEEMTRKVSRSIDIQSFPPDEVMYLNTDHNYADIENHYGNNVWVHRKGAVLARKGMEAIIPSAMGCNSYIVKGKGNPESFHSVSHGAGRKMSRTKAKDSFQVQDMINELKERDVKLFAPDKGEVLDEYRGAYKSIENVLKNQENLVEIKEELKPLSVIKG